MLLRSKTDGGVSDVRTSRSTHLRKGTPPCPSLLSKVHALTGKPLKDMEVPQVARYESGQFYRPHYDSNDPHSSGRHNEPGGQRICTVLIYLNDVSSGGGTRFNVLGLQLAPRKGAAVIFFPCFADGSLDTNALHEALPADDRKYVCQVWIRERALPEADNELEGVGHRLLAALHEHKRA